MGFLYFIVGILVVITTLCVAHQLRLARHRGISREAFVDGFCKEGVPPEIAAIVYDHYRAFSRAKEFSVAPDDSFETVFGYSHEEIDEDAEALAGKLDIELPIEMVLKQWPTPLHNLRDMVMWLEWVRQHQHPG